MAAYQRHAEQVFGDAGHTFECRLVSGREIVPAMERAARRDDIDGIIAGGGDGTISAAAAVAWKNQIALGVVPAGTMNLFARLAAAAARHLAGARRAGQWRGRQRRHRQRQRPAVHPPIFGRHACAPGTLPQRLHLSVADRQDVGEHTSCAGCGVQPTGVRCHFRTGWQARASARIGGLGLEQPFGQNALLYADDLTTGTLGFYLAKPMRPFGVARLAFDMLRGKFRDNVDVMVMHTETLHLHFPKISSKTNCVIDGELLPLERDVALKLHPGELKVMVRQGTARRVAAEEIAEPAIGNADGSDPRQVGAVIEIGNGT